MLKINQVLLSFYICIPCGFELKNKGSFDAENQPGTITPDLEGFLFDLTFLLKLISRKSICLPMDDFVVGMWKKIIKQPLLVFCKDARNVFKKDEIGLEILKIAIPATLALTADPICSLIDTAFIGHIGPVELAAAGVSIAVFNQISRIAVFPLVSITTSFVSEEDTATCSHNQYQKLEMVEHIPPLEMGTDTLPSISNSYVRKYIPSASSALVIGGILGLIQALLLTSAATPILSYMGLSSESPILNPARQYLTLRALGSPAYLLSLATQGVFRGLKDTKTPLYYIIMGDAANIVLDPILMFKLNLGVSGAAIAHVLSQYLVSLLLLWKLIQRVELLPLTFKDMQFRRFAKNGGLLMVRVVAATFCITLAVSLVAREGSTSMAAFQICLQIWLTTSLLSDGLAVAAQTILAGAFAHNDHDKITAVTSRALQFGLVLGVVLSVILVVILQFASTLFTKDLDVLKLISISVPFVAVTQPINALAFVFDGVNYGASDFLYSACSMVLVAAVTSVCLSALSWSHGYIGIWVALVVYMSLRATAGLLRVGSGTGPWRYLKELV